MGPALFVAVAVAASAAWAAGCSSESDSSSSKGASSAASTTGEGGGSGGQGGSGGAGTGGEGGQGGQPPLTPHQMFEALKPDLLTDCGFCHKLGGFADKPFLADGGVTTYATITAWPDFLVKDVATSNLLVHPGLPEHGAGNPAPDLQQPLRDAITAWLTEEAKSLPEVPPGPPTIAPFKPLVGGAFNFVKMVSLGAQFAGASITFLAAEEGNPVSILHLTTIEVHPQAGMEIHIVHPVFTVYPQGGGDPDPDPLDSYAGFDQTFAIDTDPKLGTGELILTNWKEGARLAIVFDDITVNGGAGSDVCKDIAKFQAEVMPQMQYCADHCHGGLLDPSFIKADAKAQMDLTTWNDMPPTAACDQVHARITPGDPDNSQIVLVTDPTGGTVHGYKFAGNAASHAAFKAAVTPWILGEQ